MRIPWQITKKTQENIRNFFSLFFFFCRHFPKIRYTRRASVKFQVSNLSNGSLKRLFCLMNLPYKS